MLINNIPFILFNFLIYSTSIIAKNTTLTLNSLGLGSNYFLTTNIQLGSNKQNFLVELDTGSSQLWVTSTTCKAKKLPQCAGNHFNIQQSQTFRDLQDTFSIKYDDGTNFKGELVSDQLQIGDLNYSNFGFGLINKAKYPPGDALFNIGIIGLAPTCCGETNSALIEALQHDTSIPIKQFSFYLPHNIALTGEMIIGGSNPELYTTPITWITISISDEAWNTPSIQLEDNSGTKMGSKYPAILDTGTDVVYVPETAYDAICKKLGLINDGKEDCYIACNKVSTIPNIIFDFGNNIKLTIDTQNSFFYPIDNSNCAIALTPNPDDEGFTLGMAFIRQFYTIWDFTSFSTGKVGFAKPK